MTFQQGYFRCAIGRFSKLPLYWAFLAYVALSSKYPITIDRVFFSYHVIFSIFQHLNLALTLCQN